MTMGQKVFEVVTEFRFEAQDALAKTGALQLAAGKVAGAAESALQSFKNLGGYLTNNLGFGAGLGVAGMLTMAVKSSEALTKNSLSFANIIGGNMDKLQGDIGTFNDRLQLSKQIMMDISKTAAKFSLPEQQLLNSTKMMAAMLVPKGLAGNNFSNAIDLARSFEKSAPVLGVDTGQSQGELIRMISGQASMNDTLFRRLLAETSAFQPLNSGKGGGSKAFNAMGTAERFALIQKAMAQFSSDADVNAGMAGLLASRFQVLRDKLFGINGVLIPLGQAIIPALRTALDALIHWIDTSGRQIILNLADALKAISGNPEAVIATLHQMRSALSDLQMAGKVSSFLGLASLAGFLYKIGKSIPFVNAAFATFATTIGKLVSGAAALTGMAGLRGLPLLMAGMSMGFKVLGFAMRFIILPLAALVGVFQLLSRAVGYARINDAKALANNAGNISNTIARITKAAALFMRPFYEIFDGLARLIAPLFQFSHYIGPLDTVMNALASTMEFLATAMNLAYATVQGAIFGMMQTFVELTNFIPIVFSDLMGSIQSVITGGGVDFTATKEAFGKALGGIDGAFTAGIDDIINRNLSAIENPEGPRNVANNITNIGKVEVRQDFKENMEPDRIASSLVKTLSAIAKNPTQSQGRSMQGPLLGAL